MIVASTVCVIHVVHASLVRVDISFLLYPKLVRLMSFSDQFYPGFKLISIYQIQIQQILQDNSITIQFRMQSAKSQPYFIELYAEDKTLKNKFKFVLAANTVKELRDLVCEKLIAKKEIEADTKVSLKDNDDYELASDDEVQNVITDGKVRLYRTPNATQISSAVLVPAVSQPIIAPVLPLVSVPSQPSSNLVCKDTLLNLTNLKFPQVAPEVKHRLRVYCPQIRKGLIEIPFPTTLTSYLELSQWIVDSLGLEPSLKAILYGKYGQPLIYNLDLMHLPLPKIDFSEQLSVVFTATASTVDEPVKEPIYQSLSLSSLSVIREGEKHVIDIDLENTLSVLKYKIFLITKIHPSNQIVKFAGAPLLNLAESIKSYGISDKSIVELSFKLNSNLVPCTFADKFYYKDVRHTRDQSETSVVELRANLLLLAAHLAEEDKLKFAVFVRGLTQNMPLVFALKSLFNNDFLSQTHRIALEEGLLLGVSEFIRKCTPELATLQYKDIFLHFRNFVGYVLEGIKSLTNLEEIKATEEIVHLQRNCHFTFKPIKIPRFVRLDTNEKVLVDLQAFEEQILKGFTFPSLKAPRNDSLFAPADLEEVYFQYLINQLDNPNTNAIYWLGYSDKHPQVVLPVLAAADKYGPVMDAYPDLKIHRPLQVKNKSTTYILLRNKENNLRVFVSMNKDITKPHNLFNVFTGEEQAVNLDLMSGNVRSENVEQVINAADFKPVITREPKEAIAILFDVSGSMGTSFFNEPDLRRIGAVKSFFEAFAYRTIAYNLEHVISLFFFDHTVENKCGFTEAIYDFNRLVSQAAPKGSTLMFDAAMVAVKELKSFKLKYPDCILRIIALTDGEDTGSRSTIEETATALIENNIVIDSFAVGANCEGLKVISKASGGRCYLTRNLEDSLKLFEQETVLSVRARKQDTNIVKMSLAERIVVARAQPFDLPNNVHEFKMPQVVGGLSAKDIIKKMQGSEQSKKIAGNSCLKRIAKEINNYTVNPHPFVAIFPCSNINLWKILLLGPKETPYQNGLFVLYAQFPGDYPFKAPVVRFITPIYHCNMNAQGRICHSILDCNYSPALSFRQIIDCIYGLILTPEPEDPLDNVIASYYLSDYQIYLKNAKEATLKNASMSVQAIVEELFGKIVDDSERKQKEKEISEWVTLAKSFN